MAFESLRRGVLERTGVFGTLQRQWRRDQERQLSRLEERLAHLSDALAQLDALVRTQAEDLRLRGDRTDARLEKIRESVTRAKGREEALQEALALVTAALRFDGARAPADRDAFDRDLIARHAAARIAGAEVRTDPMPHVVVDSLLPDATYAALLDAIPPEAFFPQRDRTKQNLKVSQLTIAPQATIRAWTMFDETIIADVLVPALVAKFGAWLEPGTAYAASEGRLMLRRPGYHLEPHLDPQRVAFTTLVYFARPGDSEAYGTKLFRVDPLPATRREKTFYPAEEGSTCTETGAVPFRPNSALAFMNFGGAHGADIPGDAPPETERYAYQFYVSPR